MIYCDSAYLLKWYLPESGSQQVCQLLAQHQGAACCIIGKMETASGVRRAVREGRIAEADAALIFSTMRQDDLLGLWTWLPLTPALIQAVVQAFETLPANLFLRTADAIHLACAQASGFAEIYSNDQHLLSAASHFGMVGKNVIP